MKAIQTSLGALLLFRMVSICGEAQQFVEIKADIQLATFPSKDTNPSAEAKPVRFSVVCTTGTNEWRIDHNFFKAAGDSDRWDWNKWMFDGTNVYERLMSISPFSGTNVTVNIWSSKDGCPLGDPAVNITWLAFCSGPYLKRPSRLVPLPLDILRHTPDRFGYSDRTEVFNDSFGLPKSVDLFSSQELVRESALQFHKEYFLDGRYGEFDKKLQVPEGILTFHYSVTASTNFLGHTFPIRFEFSQKGRSYQQNGDWNYRGFGVVNSIRTAGKPEGLFAGSTGQTVVDWRLRDQTNQLNGIRYSWTNGVPPAADDPIPRAAFEKSQKQKGRPITNSRISALMHEREWPIVEAAAKREVALNEGSNSSLAEGYCTPMLHTNGVWAVVVSLDYPSYWKADHINLLVSDSGKVGAYTRMTGRSEPQ